MRYCPLCTTLLTPRQLNGVERLACGSAACPFVFWGNPVPVVAAVVRYAGGILLARNRQHPPGCFSLITGFLERGETPDHGVLREVKEELGLDGRLNGLLGYYSLLEKNELTLVFEVIAEGEVTLNEELAEYKIVSWEEMDWLRQRLRHGPESTSLRK